MANAATRKGPKESPTPVPWPAVLTLGLVLMSSNMSMIMVFPLIPFMVKDFFPDMQKEELGYKVGFLGSAYFVGTFMASIIFGRLADVYGRKRTLMLGLVGTICAISLFGLSPNFYVALLARFLWGLLNGNLGVVKTVLTEICDDSNQATGFAIMGVNGGMSRILGPSIGAFLSQPAAKYKVFAGLGLFESFPYLLPCLVGVFVCCVSFVSVGKFVPETYRNPSNIDSTASRTRNANTTTSDGIDGEQQKLLSSQELVLEADGKTPVELSALSQAPSHDTDAHCPGKPPATGTIQNGGKKGEGEHEDEDEDEDDERGGTARLLRGPNTRTGPVDRSSNRGGRVRCSSMNDVAPTQSKRAGTKPARPQQQQSSPNSSNTGGCVRLREVICTRNIMISVCLYALLGMLGVIVDEIFPLWTLTPASSGGFNFTSTDIGIAVTVAGPFQLVVTIYLYPWLVGKIGYLRLFQVAGLVYATLVFMAPHLAIFNDCDRWVIFVLLSSFYSVQITLRVVCLTCTFPMIGNTSTTALRSSAYGAAQALVALARACGPTYGGSLFAWSETNGKAWPLDFHFTFYVCAIFSAATVLLSTFLPESVNRKLTDAAPQSTDESVQSAHSQQKRRKFTSGEAKAF